MVEYQYVVFHSGNIHHHVRGRIQFPHVGDRLIFQPDRVPFIQVNVFLRLEHVCVCVG